MLIEEPLYIGFGVYNSVTPATATCIAGLARRVVTMAFDCRAGTFIVPTRQQIADNFMEQEQFQYLLFVDSDVVFAPEDVQKLIEALKEDPGMGAICAHYLRRDGTRVPVCNWEGKDGYPLLKSECKEKAEKLVKEESIAEVKVFGAGLLLIDKDALKKLDFPYFDTYWDMEKYKKTGEKYHNSEDVYFALKLKKFGFRPSVHFGAPIGHMTEVVSKP